MNIFFQLIQNEATTTDSTAIIENTTSSALDAISLIMKGGIVMIPIAILSIIAVYLTIERYFTIKKAGILDSKFMGNIKSMVLDGDIKSAQTLCHSNGTPIGLMIEKGLSRIGKPLKDISVARKRHRACDEKISILCCINPPPNWTRMPEFDCTLEGSQV